MEVLARMPDDERSKMLVAEIMNFMLDDVVVLVI